MTKSADLEISNLRIITPFEDREYESRLHHLEGCITIKNDKIISVGECQGAKLVINGNGMIAIPGFIDPHTHIPFVGERSEEFVLRAYGKSYVEILKNGGGIYSTVEKIRSSSRKELVEENYKYARWLLKSGVTSFECKSGYGLDLENELKQLRAIKELSKIVSQTLIPTFLGAHAVPKQGENKYLQELTTMLKEIKNESLSQFVDVFCDEGAFSVEFSTELFKRAKEMGFKLRAHAEELSSNGFAVKASELGAVSVDHIIKIKDEEIPILSKNKTTAVLMPATSFYLKTAYAPARKLVDGGVRVALGSDFNPGSNTFYSPFFTLHLAVNHLGMSPDEALIAHTLNAAHVLGISESVGTIEAGKQADIVVLDAPSLEYLPYMPTNEHIRMVLKNGRKVFENKDNIPG